MVTKDGAMVEAGPGESATTIAVLRFDDPSGDPEQDYFARGFVEDVATELSRFPTLEVIHPQTSLALPASSPANAGVPGLLPGGYLLRGSVRRLGNMTRVAAQLVEASSSRQVWAERFDAPAERLLSVQDQIVAQVVQLNEVKGFHDLATLLAQPYAQIHCLELAGRSAEPRRDDPLLDHRARRELAAQVQALQAEIDEAESLNDQARAEQARGELDQLVAVLSQALGLGGRARRLGSATERARTAVNWRIRNAIRKIAAAHPALGRHLEHGVRTGTSCVYSPEKPVDWSV